MNKQSGFTLVEIAIVLVIIGLLLGGVLKGQELINSAKVKNFAQDFKQVPLFIYGYQDKYKRLPGDDNGAVARFGATTVDGDGNGAIAGNYNSTTLADESVRFWQHVRMAGLAAGSADFSSLANAGLPTNADGGRIGIQMATPITNMTGSYFVCSEGIQGKFAKQLDITLDDGNTATGSLRVTAQGYDGTAQAAVATASAIDGTTYTVCISF
ncbi:MAG: prepilin-type N-terminal cleavage/methylation domain-containing protein [Rhodocyclaceae bacterium]|nr:prepilin-type N-terminal cleavage/methylation domain-containing protein [Rhodocyclaceae bacterium]